MASVSKSKSFWHFERKALTNKLHTAIELEIVQSFTMFAPRRIGKTEFLEYDLKPALEENNYTVIYFSFFSDQDDLMKKFTNTLKQNFKKLVFANLKITEISLSWCKISLDSKSEDLDLLQLLTLLAIQSQKEGKTKLVLLLDEIQELQNTTRGKNLVAGLRTALDLNKEGISVIFTGSSQDGLRRMFTDRKAPFFHFGMNVQMELFGQEFTDFLADRFYERTNTIIDKDKLYDVFCRFNRITEFIRHLIIKMVLEPELSIEDAYSLYSAELYDFQRLEDVWLTLSSRTSYFFMVEIWR